VKIKCDETFAEVDLRDRINDFNFQETREGALSKVAQHFGIKKSVLDHAEFACRYVVSVQRLCGRIAVMVLAHHMQYHPNGIPTISDRASVSCFVLTPGENHSGKGFYLHSYKKNYRAHQDNYKVWVEAHNRAPLETESDEIFKRTEKAIQNHLNTWYNKMKEMMKQ